MSGAPFERVRLAEEAGDLAAVGERAPCRRRAARGWRRRTRRSPASSSAHTSTSIAAPARRGRAPARASAAWCRARRGGTRARWWCSATSTAPRSVSWWLSGWPVRCAPTTASRAVAIDAVPGRLARGRPRRSNAAREREQRAIGACRARRSDTPNGTPDARVPLGTATAARPSGFTNAVSAPELEARADRIGEHSVDGGHPGDGRERRSASIVDHQRASASARSSPQRASRRRTTSLPRCSRRAAHDRRAPRDRSRRDAAATNSPNAA